MKKYCLELRSREISYMKYVNRRQIGLVTFCVETSSYRVIEGKIQGGIADRKTRKKTYEAVG
jgi:hypothetical protein